MGAECDGQTDRPTDRQTDRPTDRRTEFSKFAPDSIDMTFVAIRRFFRVSMVRRKNAKRILHFFQNVVTRVVLSQIRKPDMAVVVLSPR